MGWFLAPFAMALSDGRVWPRTRTAAFAGLVFAMHTLVRLPALRLADGGLPTALVVLELSVLACLVMAVQVDLRARIIPHELVLAIVGAGLIKAALMPHGISGQLVGFCLIGGIMLVVGVAGRGALGAGDVKLLTASGLYLGWRVGLLAFLLSFAYAGVVGVVLLCLRPRGKRTKVPFAPFLCAGIWSAMLLGSQALMAIWPLLSR